MDIEELCKLLPVGYGKKLIKFPKKMGKSRTILDDKGNIVAEEVICLGRCGGTFFRVGNNIGNLGLRKCATCQRKYEHVQGRCITLNH